MPRFAFLGEHREALPPGPCPGLELLEGGTALRRWVLSG